MSKVTLQAKDIAQRAQGRNEHILAQEPQVLWDECSKHVTFRLQFTLGLPLPQRSSPHSKAANSVVRQPTASRPRQAFARILLPPRREEPREAPPLIPPSGLEQTTASPRLNSALFEPSPGRSPRLSHYAPTPGHTAPRLNPTPQTSPSPGSLGPAQGLGRRPQ
ncbi:unnamed protein product, partial [Rangifer tarandus platyrhynchus]